MTVGTLDRATATRFLDALLGGLPPECFSYLWTMPTKASRWFAADGYADALATIDASRDVYYPIAFARARGTTNDRIGNEKAAGIVALAGDVDFGTCGHKKAKLPPTEEKAREIIDALPLPFSALVNTGGGLQPAWFLAEPWEFTDEAERADAELLLRGWGRVIAAAARRAGYEADPVHDLAHVFRLPGTVNHKNEGGSYDPTCSRLVTLVELHPGRQFSPDDFREYVPVEEPETPSALRRFGTSDLSDEELRMRIFRAKDGEQLFRLWQGDTSGFPSQSEADWRLIGALCFWVGPDPERIERLFRQSRLWREDKWFEPHFSGGESYGAGTIRKQLEGRKEFHPRVRFTDDANGPPLIRVNGRWLRDQTADALAALEAANSPPVLFRRTGGLARVTPDEKGRPVIVPVGEAELRGSLERAANFAKVVLTKDKVTGEEANSIAPVPPPRDVVEDVLALGAWPFPALDAVVETPVLRPDGTVLDRPGYDEATGLYFAPAVGLTVRSVAEAPTDADVERAVAMIDELLRDFPFVGDGSRAGAWAALLTPILRPALRGHVPLIVIDAPQAGTGKTLLAVVIAVVGTGRPAAMLPAPQTDDEWRKRLTSVLDAGATCVVIDNVEGALQAPSLASAITAHTWGDRVLGQSRIVQLPQRATWIATGNNVTLRGDLPRRCVWVRLDAETNRPWERSEFRHPDLVGFAEEKRPHLVWALLTLARAWYARGRPNAGCKRLGSFEDWCEAVGGILKLAGVEGFLSNLEEMYQRADGETLPWEQFLGAWFTEFGDREMKLADVIAATGDALCMNIGPEHVPDECCDGRTGEVNMRRLGKAVAKRADQRFGEKQFRLTRGEAHQGAVRWRVLSKAG